MGSKKLEVTTFVRGWRKYRGLTLEELAEQADLSASGISQLERGLQGFTDESLARIAKALHCSAAELLSYDPRRKDTFWRHFEAAEKLEGRERRQLLGIISSALNPDADGSE